MFTIPAVSHWTVPRSSTKEFEENMRFLQGEVFLMYPHEHTPAINYSTDANAQVMRPLIFEMPPFLFMGAQHQVEEISFCSDLGSRLSVVEANPGGSKSSL